jgi:hypothetical protein
VRPATPFHLVGQAEARFIEEVAQRSLLCAFPSSPFIEFRRDRLH